MRSYGVVGRGFFAITSLHLESPNTGSFALKFFPSAFGNLLTDSNFRPSDARSEIFSDRNENHSAACLGLCEGRCTSTGSMTKPFDDLAARSSITEKPLL